MQLIKSIITISLLLFTGIALAQDSTSTKKEDVTIDFLFNYYQQDGNNSPVTGGQGTEYIDNYAPKIAVTVPMGQKHVFSGSLGVDAYSSASSDNVSNPLRFVDQKSGASASDVRMHGTAGYTYKNKEKRTEYGGGVGGSVEFDVYSGSADFSFSKTTKDGNKTTSIAASYFYDKWKLIYPVELRNGNNELLPTDVRQSMNFSLSQSFVLSKRIAMSVTADATYQTGLLSTPFHRVYFNDFDGTNENVLLDALIEKSNLEILPSQRLKSPVALRFNIAPTNFLMIRSYYRFYGDTWGVLAHTAKIEAPIKIGQIFRLYPFYRYHKQSAARYYAPFNMHDPSSSFYTSDTDLSSFQSHKFGLGFSIDPLYGLLRFKGGQKKVNMLKTIDLRYAYYTRSDGLKANMVTLGVKYLIQRN